MAKTILLFIVMSLVLGFYSCTDANDLGEPQILFEEIKALQCKELTLKLKVDSIWGHLSENLEQSLPVDMPYQERINMVTIQNADLIRMFDRYDSLSPATHRLVDTTEMLDKKIVEEYSKIKSEMATLEEKRMILFEKVEQRSPDELIQLRSRFAEILATDCN